MNHPSAGQCTPEQESLAFQIVINEDGHGVDLSFAFHSCNFARIVSCPGLGGCVGNVSQPLTTLLFPVLLNLLSGLAHLLVLCFDLDLMCIDICKRISHLLLCKVEPITN